MRAMFRIRRLAQDRVVDGRRIAAPFQVQRRVAWLFWREVAVCRDHETASLMLHSAARARRLASLKPLLVARYDANGRELS
ncbi:hypothetical protein C6P76_18095 [Burkholderia multivorans]|nr:hypothetical protein C6P76_18095 [Burkholderia multivorans]